MINKLKMTALVAAFTGLCVSVQANPINGDISFDGAVTLNGSLKTATAITGYSSLTVLGGLETGTYAPLNAGGGNGVNGISGLDFSTFGFGGNVLTPSPLSPLWTVNFGGNVYSFDATSVQIVTQINSFLNLSGNGVAYLNGGDATLGTWTITDTTGSGLKFTFGSSALVPDSGTTVGLLGAGLAGCALLNRKLKLA
jgi:hypothetical protein